MFKTVLFPIDMSSEAQQAATKVAELVKFHQSRLVLLSVVEPVDPATPPPMPKPRQRQWLSC